MPLIVHLPAALVAVGVGALVVWWWNRKRQCVGLRCLLLYLPTSVIWDTTGLFNRHPWTGLVK
jgi:hypothetical protein